MNYTTYNYGDGLGAQFQKVILTYIYCKLHNLNFLYRPINKIEHNYNNDINFIPNIENLINLKNNISNINDNINFESLNFNIVGPYSEENIDTMCQTEHLQFLKNCFWENKKKKIFRNNKINVAIHIRRDNSHDCYTPGGAGGRSSTPNDYYLNVMNIIRNKYNKCVVSNKCINTKTKKINQNKLKSKNIVTLCNLKSRNKKYNKLNNNNILFHIYSQGDIKDFDIFKNKDTKLHINEDICSTFLSMVAADILVMSASSLSYSAALLSDGKIYYKKFWHNPRKNWISMEFDTYTSISDNNYIVENKIKDMEIIIHNPGHSGDILHTLEFVKIFIKSNPFCKFTLVPASCKCLYDNLISDNVKIIEHNCRWISVLKKNELIKPDTITKLHDVLIYYESDKLYINSWKMLVEDNTNCINLIGRKDFIKNIVNKTNSLYNLNIQFNCNSDIELIPILPDINIDKIENYLKSLNKKFIFFYNLNSTCGIESEYRVNINDEVINNLLSEIDNDTILLVAKKTEIQNSKIINLESDLNIQMSNDGKNLLVYEKISRMCDKIYFKINGGSEFILNKKNINIDKNFYLINSNNSKDWYNIIKTSYLIKNLNIYN